jgi:hypothetical protein
MAATSPRPRVRRTASRGQLSDAVGEVQRVHVDPVAPGNGSAACCCAAWRPWRGYAAAGCCVWRPARSSPRRCGCTARPDGGASSATAPSRTTRAPSASRNDRRGPVGGHAGRRPFTADPRVGRAHLALEPTPEVLPETRGVIGVRGRRRCSSGGAGRRRRGAGGGAHRGADSVNSRMTSRCPPLGRLCLERGGSEHGPWTLDEGSGSGHMRLMRDSRLLETTGYAPSAVALGVAGLGAPRSTRLRHAAATSSAAGTKRSSRGSPAARQAASGHARRSPAGTPSARRRSPWPSRRRPSRGDTRASGRM